MRALDVCDVERWNNLCVSLNIESDDAIYSALVEAHAEKHRAYHTLNHIAACLRHLDIIRDKSERPEEIEMALWFHDAVYKPFSSTNEEDSAKWAATWLRERGVSEDVVKRIEGHILATESHVSPEALDQQYMLDIDLSILGSPPKVYDTFERNIQLEYKHVPGFLFRKKRKAILEGFLARPEIYTTPHFRQALESQARTNIAHAISNF